MFRALLLAIKPEPSTDFVIDYASSLAEQHQLQVDACAVIDAGRLAPAEAVPLGGGAFKSHKDQEVITTARQEASAMMSRAMAACEARGVRCASHVLDGDTVTVLARAAQSCDVLICGQPLHGDAHEHSLLHAILKHSPRPAIIVPQARFSMGPVLVAYDGSLQAARALASFAESGLADGRTVHISAFDEGSEVAKGHAEIAKAFLLRHGIDSEARVSALPKDAGSLVLDEARRLAAGLIVMGAFGKSTVREFFFGSASRTILRALPVPVFLDH